MKKIFCYLTLVCFLAFTQQHYVVQRKTASAAQTQREMETNSIPILMYHKVSPAQMSGGLGLRVTPENFEAQMKLLARLGYRTISLDSLTDYIISGAKLPNNNKVIVISFDDGYRDNYLWARPILKKYKFNAIIFLVSAEIGRTNTWDKGRRQPLNYLLNRRQINTMLSEGFEFGSHSKTHQFLTKLDKKTATAEIKESKQQLEQQLGIKIKYFCYPFGRYNQTVVDLVKSTGYSAALTTVQGKVTSGDNLYSLKRIRVTGRIKPRDLQQLVENGTMKPN